jgi:hypothetical protein
MDGAAMGETCHPRLLPSHPQIWFHQTVVHPNVVYSHQGKTYNLALGTIFTRPGIGIPGSFQIISISSNSSIGRK